MPWSVCSHDVVNCVFLRNDFCSACRHYFDVLRFFGWLSCTVGSNSDAKAAPSKPQQGSPPSKDQGDAKAKEGAKADKSSHNGAASNGAESSPNGSGGAKGSGASTSGGTS